MAEKRKIKVLCVGNDPDLLKLRCAVLGRAGHDTRSATIPEAEILLLTEQFDVIILPSRLSRDERARVLAAAGTTKTLELIGVTFPAELLREVDLILAPMSRTG